MRQHGVHPDRPVDDLDVLRPAGEAFLRANPGMALHHTHDGNQDRLMIAGMSYFRVKWRAMPEAYRRFVAERLAPGGVVVAVDCGQRWPVTTVGDRYVFQHGAIGGATVEEIRFGGSRVAATWPGTGPRTGTGWRRNPTRRRRRRSGASPRTCSTTCGGSACRPPGCGSRHRTR